MEKLFKTILLLASVVLATSDNDNCKLNCDHDDDPVCGFNGEKFQTFENECQFKLETCMEPENWELNFSSDCNNRPKFDKKNCPLPCPRNLSPVCGYDGVEYKIFSNECMMLSQQCNDGHEWKRVLMRSCQQNNEQNVLPESGCPKVCHLDNIPVCGFNGKTYQIFGNQCEFDRQNCLKNYVWKLTSLSNCHEESLPKSRADCVYACPDIYDPRCGYNGKVYKMFPSECDLIHSNCHDELDWKITRLDDCN